ncbi:four-helix bundle copper-binding protein [Fibrisoma montanum]|uniref:Four-helix bundle copper-binding protein n=1 Tax=Fibrisoma montanum TaxID=2305895 RepID=A0A418MHD0_9BACT|nr:four-helix bundle copper-binding protein [Fibrisoma montanum]RIV26773.1 four-helix bundle copper-binding protein [Fibrisoma montanum]
MIWKKNIYDSLTGCAALCDEFATECSRSEDIENWYRCIFLNLDCADMCRQLAMLYVRGSENTRLLAKACIEVCEKCAQEVNQFTDHDRCQQVHAMCQQTIRSCVSILEMAYQSDADLKNPATTPASLFYGIDLRDTLYN